MRWLKKFAESLIASSERIGRAEALRFLRNLSQPEQIRLGFSPELLRKGVNAWPWHLEPTVATAPELSPEKIRKAEAELSAYTDRELAELGIGRGDISYVVRHGRPGIDRKAA